MVRLVRSSYFYLEYLQPVKVILSGGQILKLLLWLVANNIIAQGGTENIQNALSHKPLNIFQKFFFKVFPTYVYTLLPSLWDLLYYFYKP